MDQDIDKLLTITRDMSLAFDRDDLDTCASLLADRGILLQTLSARYGEVSGYAVPATLRAIMATIREQDQALEERLTASLSETGRRIGEIQQKTRRDDGGTNSIYVNRRA